MHYDNRADPAAAAPELRDFAWYTEFDAAALRIESGGGWTLLLQALDGETTIDPYVWLTWTFDSQSALVAKRSGAHLLTARYDAFRVLFEGDAAAAGSETGHAWTVAYSWDRGGPWRLALEWLRVSSDVPARALYLAEAPFARETQLQFSARYSLGGMY